MTLQATVLGRKLRACDLDDLPHEWDTRYELVGGVLFVSRRPSVEHQETIANLVWALLAPVKALGGKVLPEPGVLWEEDGDDNVSPDVVVMLPDRLAIVQAKKIRGAPHLVVEVLSPGPEAARRDLEAKRGLYWRRGVDEYWIVDPEARTLRRMTRGAADWDEERLSEDAVVCTPLLPAWPGVAVAELLPPR